VPAAPKVVIVLAFERQPLTLSAIFRLPPQPFQSTTACLKTDEYSSVFGFRKALKSRISCYITALGRTSDIAGARLGLVVAKRFLRRSVDRNLVGDWQREFPTAACPPSLQRFRAAPGGQAESALDRQALALEIQRSAEQDDFTSMMSR
jgi:hypothetical protein